MTSLGLLFVIAWVGGIAVTAASLRNRRPLLTAVGAGIFVGTVLLWMKTVLSQL